MLVAIPIAVANKIKFAKISKSKQLIFDNQELGNVTRVYMVFPSAFWRVKYSGYASFSSKFFFNEITDLSPHNLSCGILAFVFVGNGFERMKEEMPEEGTRKNYLIKVIADIFLKGKRDSEMIERAFMF